MENLAFILGLIILLFIFLAVYKEIKYYNFQNNMKVGDNCFFFVGEIRYFGWIEKIEGSSVVCKNDYNSFSVERVNVHPL